MKIKFNQIKVNKLVEGYCDDGDDGVRSYAGRLDIRPPYQREFVYDAKKSEAVIHSLLKDYPLNVMYWAVNDDDHYEIIDGQQRTISICQYATNIYPISGPNGEVWYFDGLPKDKQDQILNYELMIYFCEGSDSERLEWFQIINLAGMVLTKQELRNTNYAGKWLYEAKRYFSKPGCPAYSEWGDYIKGSAIRQEYLETALKWIVGRNGKIEKYMADHRKDKTADELWKHFNNALTWASTTFTDYNGAMKGLDWGYLYNEHNTRKLNPKSLTKRVDELMKNEAVTSKRGIYEYLLTGKEKHLSIRAFDQNQRRTAYARQQGVCIKCKKEFKFGEMEADHIKPWHEGGLTTADNCQMLCKEHNRLKGGK